MTKVVNHLIKNHLTDLVSPQSKRSEDPDSFYRGGETIRGNPCKSIESKPLVAQLTLFSALLRIQ
jgi:hypothetical protein